jgi:hypothetical protein
VRGDGGKTSDPGEFASVGSKRSGIATSLPIFSADHQSCRAKDGGRGHARQVHHCDPLARRCNRRYPRRSSTCLRVSFRIVRCAEFLVCQPGSRDLFCEPPKLRLAACKAIADGRAAPRRGRQEWWQAGENAHSASECEPECRLERAVFPLAENRLFLEVENPQSGRACLIRLEAFRASLHPGQFRKSQICRGRMRAGGHAHQVHHCGPFARCGNLQYLRRSCTLLTISLPIARRAQFLFQCDRDGGLFVSRRGLPLAAFRTFRTSPSRADWNEKQAVGNAPWQGCRT